MICARFDELTILLHLHSWHPIFVSIVSFSDTFWSSYPLLRKVSQVKDTIITVRTIRHPTRKIVWEFEKMKMQGVKGQSFEKLSWYKVSRSHRLKADGDFQMDKSGTRHQTQLSLTKRCTYVVKYERTRKDAPLVYQLSCPWQMLGSQVQRRYLLKAST